MLQNYQRYGIIKLVQIEFYHRVENDEFDDMRELIIKVYTKQRDSILAGLRTACSFGACVIGYVDSQYFLLQRVMFPYRVCLV